MCRSSIAGARAMLDRIRRDAAELAALAPDVILTGGAATAGPMLQATRTVPIVFANVTDPVGAGFTDSLARPGGNATGFTQFEYGISAKWLELLKQIAPDVTRAAVLRDPAIPSGIGQFGVIQSVAQSFGVELSPVNVRDVAEIERAVAAFARSSNGGLIVTASGLASVHREPIITLAARHKLPAVYYERFFVAAGGLISYGPDFVSQYRRAASYVDRILKGEKPADMPVQAPTKYDLVINLKTAKALGLDGAAITARHRRRGDRMTRIDRLAARALFYLLALTALAAAQEVRSLKLATGELLVHAFRGGVPLPAESKWVTCQGAGPSFVPEGTQHRLNWNVILKPKGSPAQLRDVVRVTVEEVSGVAAVKLFDGGPTVTDIRAPRKIDAAIVLV